METKTFESKLLPCPFCSGDVEMKEMGKNEIQIKCPNCTITYRQATLRYGLDWLAENMVERWNKRSETASPQPAISKERIDDIATDISVMRGAQERREAIVKLLTESLTESVKDKELEKMIGYIRRNVDKINVHTWKMYKEQIQAHIEDAENIITSRTT